jgi:predicted enzyme related to lactoylglutathione lyase
MATFTHAKSAGTPTWVDLVSPDPEASRNFYHALFGWAYDIGGPEFGGYATARKGSWNTAGIGGQPPGAPANMPAFWQLYFASDDLKNDIARAQQLGAKEVYPSMEVGVFGGMASLADPTGAEFNFWRAGTHVGTQLMDEHGGPAWFELYTPDAKKARDFYTALLGMTADPMPGGLEYYILKRGDDMHAGIMQIDPAWGNLPPFWSIYFAVDDTDKAVEIVQKNGGQLQGNIEDTPFGRMAAVADPHGANFKLIKPPAQ